MDRHLEVFAWCRMMIKDVCTYILYIRTYIRVNGLELKANIVWCKMPNPLQDVKQLRNVRWECTSL